MSLDMMQPEEQNLPTRGRIQRLLSRFRRVLMTAILLFAAATTTAAELELVVQSERWTKARDLSAVSSYLSQVLGETVRISIRPNPLEHWRRLAAGERPAMVLEDPHFADYRVTRSGYRIVAAVEGRQVFSLAAGSFLLLDPMDLAGRPVAALPPPSLSTLQLLAFYSDVVHMPRIIEAPSYRAAAARVQANDAVAAVIPLEDLAAYPGMNGAVVMEELPGKAFSIAPEVAEAVADRLTSALVDAAALAEGRRALTQLEVRGFVRAHREAYDGISRLLKGSWGFRQIPP